MRLTLNTTPDGLDLQLSLTLGGTALTLRAATQRDTAAIRLDLLSEKSRIAPVRRRQSKRSARAGASPSLPA